MLKKFSFAVLGVCILILGYELGQRIWYELSGILADDVLIYMAVARGILNGLTPYVDLFETKPPGIFLILAGSLWLTGGVMLAKVFHLLSLLGIGVLTVLPVWSAPALRQDSVQAPGCSGESVHERWMMRGIAVVFAMLLVLYTAAMAGELQVETFGAFFGIAAVMYFASHPSWQSFLCHGEVLCSEAKKPQIHTQKRLHLRVTQLLLTSLLLLLAIGTKEPFFLTTFAAALLLMPLRELTVRFGIPLLIAGVLGAVALMLLGWLIPYITIYLPHIANFHVPAHGSLLARSLSVHKVMQNLWDFSPFFLLVIAGLWVVVATFYLLSSRRSSIYWGCVRPIAAFLLTIFAISVGGDFYAHHFVFAVPVYVSLFWKYLSFDTFFYFPRVTLSDLPEADCIEVRHGGNKKTLRMTLPISVVLLLTTLFHARTPFQERLEQWRHGEEVYRDTAALVDSALDQCGWDRYLHLVRKGGGIFAYTEHSPTGPVFTQYTRFMGFENSPFVEPFKDVILNVPLIVFEDLETTHAKEVVRNYIRGQFSERPPECAQGFEQPTERYRVWFRK